MKKRNLILSGTALLLAMLLIQPVQAAATTVSFATGSQFVWRWTSYTYNPDMSLENTTIRYRLMNVTAVTPGVDHANISARYQYTDQADYEANGLAGSSWSAASPMSSKMLDNNATYWYTGFYCKNGFTTILNMLTLSAEDKYLAFARMHVMPVPEFFAIQFALAFLSFMPSNWNTTSATITLALIGYVSGSLDIAFGYLDSGKWMNTTVKCTSSFTFSAMSMVLKSCDSTLDMTVVEWNSTTSSYQTTAARSRNAYDAVFPQDIANYIPVEWFIGGGIGLLLIIVISSAIHKKKK